ncbi:hypothetical protein M438DRAFT_391569 [Aureobasidium pullulans EXF-150]|uniref:Rhodopsin domain-containing protein n=1 Tax=Aureobasidium pullulans EXF-150 TaxID=1043002 RepID=A0A074XIY4_AURPU|nr:uncharacterized protein M438DRAFT_391569 [Aureobasidium pullulans EXF-150]KEQ85483.1 hypothetical protein M438DRAFT_391569 [Aureobasidium pullulans EXF-150]
MSFDNSPLSPVTSTDHRGWLWITVIICTIICPALLLWRGIARYRRYGLDDLAVVVSFVFIIAHLALLMGSLKLGFGVQLIPETKPGILKAAELVFASRITLSLILGTSKLSALLLIRRLLPPNTWRTYICNTGLVLVVVWGIMAILTTNTACLPSHMLLRNAENSCAHLDIRIATTMALNIATEFGVISLAVCFLRRMQVEGGQRKWVALGFLLRLPNIALSLLYLTFYLHFLSRGHSSIGFIPTAIIQCVLATYSFTSSCIPSFLPFSLPIFTPSPSSSPIELTSSKLSRNKLARRMSTPMSFFGDKIRGDREIFTHKARIFADVKGVQRRESERKLRRKDSDNVDEDQESLRGIVREETFEIKMDRYSGVGGGVV